MKLKRLIFEETAEENTRFDVNAAAIEYFQEKLEDLMLDTARFPSQVVDFIPGEIYHSPSFFKIKSEITISLPGLKEQAEYWIITWVNFSGTEQHMLISFSDLNGEEDTPVFTKALFGGKITEQSHKFIIDSVIEKLGKIFDLELKKLRNKSEDILMVVAKTLADHFKQNGVKNISIRDARKYDRVSVKGAGDYRTQGYDTFSITLTIRTSKELVSKLHVNIDLISEYGSKSLEYGINLEPFDTNELFSFVDKTLKI